MDSHQNSCPHFNNTMQATGNVIRDTEVKGLCCLDFSRRFILLVFKGDNPDNRVCNEREGLMNRLVNEFGSNLHPIHTIIPNSTYWDHCEELVWADLASQLESDSRKLDIFPAMWLYYPIGDHNPKGPEKFSVISGTPRRWEKKIREFCGLPRLRGSMSSISSGSDSDSDSNPTPNPLDHWPIPSPEAAHTNANASSIFQDVQHEPTFSLDGQVTDRQPALYASPPPTSRRNTYPFTPSLTPIASNKGINPRQASTWPGHRHEDCSYPTGIPPATPTKTPKKFARAQKRKRGASSEDRDEGSSRATGSAQTLSILQTASNNGNLQTQITPSSQGPTPLTPESQRRTPISPEVGSSLQAQAFAFPEAEAQTPTPRGRGHQRQSKRAKKSY